MDLSDLIKALQTINALGINLPSVLGKDSNSTSNPKSSDAAV